MINGTLLYMSGDELAEYLKTISAEDISKIEIITNPPSSYDAQGNSGLINLVTKKIKKQGYYSTIRLGVDKTTFYAYDGGLTFNLYKGRFYFLSSSNFAKGAIQTTGLENTRYSLQTWENILRGKDVTNQYGGKAELGYQLNSKTSIGLMYGYRRSAPEVERTNNLAIRNNFNTLDSLIIAETLLKGNKYIKTFNIHIQHLVDSIEKKITFDADWLNFDDDNSNFFNNDNFLPNGKSTNLKEFNLSKNTQRIKLYTMKTDYFLPSKIIDLSVGAKLSLLKTNNEFGFYQLYDSDYKINPSRSNKFKYKENTQAAYISLEKQLKMLSFQLGARIECTQIEANSVNINHIYLNNYNQLFPTAGVNYDLNNKHSISLNYNKRIDRPNYALLNPFREYSTIYNYEEGNPLLKPSTINNLELAHTYNGFLNTSLTFSREKNKIDLITFVNDSSNVQASTYLNYLTGRSITLNISATLNFSEWFESSNQLSLEYITLKSSIPNTTPRLTGLNTFLSSTNQAVLNKLKTLMASVEVEYQLPYIDGLFKSNGYFICNVGVKILPPHKKFQVTITGSDIFKTSKPIYNYLYSNGRCCMNKKPISKTVARQAKQSFSV